MTRLEDRIRRALREKADQVPGDAVPPLGLPASRRRSSSLTYGGGQRRGAPASSGWLAPAASAILVAAVIAGSVAVSRLVAGSRAPAPGGQVAASGGPASSRAAGWIAAAVSRSALVSCDPAMCRALRARGIPARDLDPLRPGTDLLRSQVVVATAAVRREFGQRLGTVDAPAIIASFGSGNARIDVRVTAPEGAAAYRSALRADFAARKASGAQVLASPRVRISAAARKQLMAGCVDARLLITIVSITGGQFDVSVLSFGDAGPGAGTCASSPLRSVVLAGAGNTPAAGGLAAVRQMRAFLGAQKPPYAAALARTARLPGGQPVLRIVFAAPAPLGLLST